MMRSHSFTRAFAVRVAIATHALCACADDPKPAASAAPAASSGEEAESEKRAFDRAHHMQASLWLAIVARNSIVDGDLEEAKAAGRALAAHDYADTIPEDWKAWIGEVKKHGEEIAIAAGIEDAAQAVAAVGLACGNCHYQVQSGPNVGREAPLAWRDGPDTIDERMARHSLGIEQMWAGLVDPSEEAWRSGTITLTRAPLTVPTTHDDTVSARGSAEIERVRELARGARFATTHTERARIYGELIAGCGNCHTTTAGR